MEVEDVGVLELGIEHDDDIRTAFGGGQMQGCRSALGSAVDGGHVFKHMNQSLGIARGTCVVQC